MANFETIIRKRGGVKGQLTRFSIYVANLETITENLDKKVILELETRVDNLPKLWSSFDDIQTEAESMVDDLEDQERERENFETLYYSSMGSARSILRQHASNETNRSQQDKHNIKNVTLPTIHLPNFDGCYQRWITFRDTFTSLIHDNNSINTIQKFHYLRMSLRNEASHVVQSLEVTENNYSIAWELLNKRYENKRLIIHNHIESLFNLRPITREAHTALREILDDTLKHLRALKNLGEPTDSWDTLIIYLISSKLDNSSKREWETLVVNDMITKPTFNNFSDFLANKSNLLLTLRPSLNHQQVKHISNHQSKPVNKSNNLVTLNKPQCSFCNLQHFVIYCKLLSELNIKDRIAQIKEKQLCFNCLRKGHDINSCLSKSSCKHCNKRHHTLLHIEAEKTSTVSEPIPSSSKISVVNHATSNSNYSQILLSTACVYVQDDRQIWQKCRVLLDNGSQSNFITNEFHQRLNLRSIPVKFAIVGINQANLELNRKTELTIRSIYNTFETSIDCLIISKITENLPNVTFDASQLGISKNIRLADPDFYKESKIDMLLGASTFWQLLCIGQVKLGTNNPILQKTKLGWIVSGPLSVQSNNKIKRLSCNLNININEQLQRFWALEECHARDQLSIEDKKCEEHFVNTTTRDTNGRFIVDIPFKQEIFQLGESRTTAIKRFYSIEKRLIQNKPLQLEYVKFMQEYEQLGHMKRIDETMQTISNSTYYLPHHAVIKESSTTTKTRVVFDGSAKTTSGLSLNDVQMSGPTVQNDLFTILLRFRRHPYALTADIEKMYRQIIISEPHRKYHRIFWRSNPKERIQCYELQTVTYGTASAPFLATRCLNQLAYEYSSRYSFSCNVILNDFYVDDLVTGANSITELITLKNELTFLLNSVGFHLRKWLCNNSNICDVSSDETLNFCEEHTRTLGLLWSPTIDVFKYNLIGPDDATSFTKRTILSITAKIFDPLGLLNPVIVVAKLIIQELWQCQLSWDESIPHDLHYKWITFLNDLKHLNLIHIPRYILMLQAKSIQCHGFADSSEKAYGACVYVRTTDESGNIKVSLICAKSRVAPLKKITLPRLELCAALLLTKLASKVKQDSGINFNSCYFWSDSTITLHWIKSDSSKWQTFVANRVTEIQTQSEPSEWFHVKSPENPADLLSRGTSLLNLSNNALWWNGPSWLSHNINEWPAQPPILTTSDISHLPDLKKSITLTLKTAPCIFTRYSTLTKLQRVTAWCLRFHSNCQKPAEQRQSGPLILGELDVALTTLLKLAQQQVFPEDLQQLVKGNCKAKGSLRSLTPFLDENGLLRVGGRINLSNFPFNKKHPIILPKNHILTELIIKYEHIKLLHSGTQSVLYSLREKYWPISGKNMIKRVIQACMTCFKVNPPKSNYIMGNLPQHRLLSGSIFEICGIDYAGPFYIKEKKFRNTKFIKGYICLFVCFSTKAVHLELVTELTTDAFLATLRRFISRRGKPHTIYSDNGTNFVGAKRKLDEFAQFINSNNVKNDIVTSLTGDRIVWQFSPPYSPHFGGLWEAGVKSTKAHLKRVIGNASLCFEDFYTVLTQIEAILNSRPISPLSNDPSDLNPLTPGHFLIGKPLTSTPEPNVANIHETKLTQFQRLQQLVQHFWNRWNKEYVSELQTRTKWTQRFQELLTIGSLVLLREDNQPPLHWKLARVLHLHSGDDGVTRVVTVKTANGTLKRGVRQLCVLPLPPNEQKTNEH